MGEYYIAHSAKGKTWSKHKYISKKLGKTGKYIYEYAKKAGEEADWKLGGREKDKYEKAKDFEKYQRDSYKDAKKYSDRQKKTNGENQDAANGMTEFRKKKYDEAHEYTKATKKKYEKTPKARIKKAKKNTKKLIDKIWNKVYTKEPSVESYYRTPGSSKKPGEGSYYRHVKSSKKKELNRLVVI